MVFEVSTARVDITPSPQSNPYLAGYGSQTEPRVVDSAEPHRPLNARCLVLWDGEHPRAIVTLDVLGIPRTMSRRLRPRLEALAAWGEADIILQATHTHNGPVLVDHLHPFATYGLSDLTRIRSYTAHLEDTLVELVGTALGAERTAASLEYSVASETFAYNRRGLPYVETDVPVLVARSSEGSPRAALFGYGAHPTAGGIRTQWDPDFPGGACAAVEEAFPDCFAMFLQGAAGDQGVRGITGFDLSDSLGAQLGFTVVRAIAQPARMLSGPMTTRLAEFQLPLEISTDPGTVAAFRRAFTVRIGNPEGQPAYYQRHAELMVSRLDTGNIATSVPLVGQAWTFQGPPVLHLLFTSGELVSGYAEYFRARYGGSNQLWIGGYANELPCYIPSNEFFPPTVTWGSYEGGWGADFPGIGGASMAAYGWAAHFRPGPDGVESAVIAGLKALLD